MQYIEERKRERMRVRVNKNTFLKNDFKHDIYFSPFEAHAYALVSVCAYIYASCTYSNIADHFTS